MPSVGGGRSVGGTERRPRTERRLGLQGGREGTLGSTSTRFAVGNEIVRMPDAKGHVKNLHLRPLGGTPADMRAFVEAERQRWASVIQASNIRLD